MPDADRHIDDDELERYVRDRLSDEDAAPIDTRTCGSASSARIGWRR